MKILSIFVAFLENMNFKLHQLHELQQHLELRDNFEEFNRLLKLHELFEQSASFSIAANPKFGTLKITGLWGCPWSNLKILMITF